MRFKLDGAKVPRQGASLGLCAHQMDCGALKAEARFRDVSVMVFKLFKRTIYGYSLPSNTLRRQAVC